MNQPKKTNTLRIIPKEVQETKREVIITEREMAIYRHVALKLRYQHDEVQGIADRVRPVNKMVRFLALGL